MFLTGISWEALERAVRLAFATIFPDYISTCVQRLLGIDAMTVSELIERFRVITPNARDVICTVRKTKASK